MMNEAWRFELAGAMNCQRAETRNFAQVQATKSGRGGVQASIVSYWRGSAIRVRARPDDRGVIGGSAAARPRFDRSWRAADHVRRAPRTLRTYSPRSRRPGHPTSRHDLGSPSRSTEL